MKITKDEIKNLKKDLKKIKIGVIGDGCIDIYWDANMKLSKLSRETPHYPLPIVNERIYLGAASNVVNNLYSLGAEVEFLTVIGDDWRGREFKKIISDMELDNRFIITSSLRQTPAYCKPMRSGISEVIYEDPRLDFENHSPLDKEVEKKVIENLKIMSEEVEVLIVSDQFYHGIITNRVIKELFRLKDKGLKIIVDSRENIPAFKGLFIKPNEVEIYELLGEETNFLSHDPEKILSFSNRLWKANQNDMIVTLGEKGAVLIERDRSIHIPTKPVNGSIDIVGCGDAFISGFSLGIALGLSKEKSIELANLVAGIVIKKIGITGSATIKEVLNEYDFRE